jgi:hypothetical protein
VSSPVVVGRPPSDGPETVRRLLLDHLTPRTLTRRGISAPLSSSPGAGMSQINSGGQVRAGLGAVTCEFRLSVLVGHGRPRNYLALIGVG